MTKDNTNPLCFPMTDVNDCAEQPCKNKGVCRDLEGDYTCQCPSPYVGKQCHMRRSTKYTTHEASWPTDF